MNDAERTSLAEGLERIIAHLERARRDGFRVVMHRATLAMEPAPHLAGAVRRTAGGAIARQGC